MARLAVISDVHGNAFALDAVLASIQRDGVDQIVYLGDIAEGGPRPFRVTYAYRPPRWNWPRA